MCIWSILLCFLGCLAFGVKIQLLFLASKFMVKILCAMVSMASPILKSICGYKCVCGPFFMFCGVFYMSQP
jgi:hypothetical protein